MTDILTMKNVSKNYPRKNQADVLALDDVSLRVATGDFVALHGPSGSGKSTLLLVAGGLLRPTSGEVLIEGQELYVLNNSQRAELRAKSIAYLYQQFYLVPYLSVLDNVRITDLAKKDGSLEKAKSVLDQFQMTDRLTHLPSQLSVGEQQRVALARVIYSEAKIILADEPTGNLDQENAEIVLNALRRFTEDGGCVVLVTHDEKALKYAKTELKMANGKVFQPK